MKTKGVPWVWSMRSWVILFLCLLTGCSTFNRDWDRAVSQAVPPTSLEGPWDGSWLSAVNGHHGRLRCLMTKESEISYQARFHARFWKIFSHGYAVSLRAIPTNTLFRLEGQEDLGKLVGGVYTYEGEAGPTNFVSRYSSKYDQGTFQLHRP